MFNNISMWYMEAYMNGLNWAAAHPAVYCILESIGSVMIMTLMLELFGVWKVPGLHKLVCWAREVNAKE